MTGIVSSLTLSVLMAGAQDPQGSARPLSKVRVELDVLRVAVRESFVADRAYDMSESMAERKATSKVRKAALAALDAAVLSFEAKAGRRLLLDAEALASAFALACAPNGEPGEVGAVSLHGEGLAAHVQYLPRGYDGSEPYPTVCLVAGRQQQGDEKAIREYLAGTWQEAAARERMLVVAPVMSADLDLDAVKPTAKAEFAAESKRIGSVLRPMGESWTRLHTSRDRMVLDCGRGASAFGLRLASKFSDRFACVVLRWPVLDDKLRIEALSGMPVLLVRCPETADACSKLRDLLHAQAPGSCQILTPPSEYPYASEVGIAEWVRHNRRQAMPSRVVLAPSDDRFRRKHWIAIRKQDPVGSAPWDKAPLVVAEADRKRNCIVVTTRGVQEFTLLVGPALVDVRKFALVVNGDEQEVRLEPSFGFLRNFVQDRSDTSQLFTASHRVTLH